MEVMVRIESADVHFNDPDNKFQHLTADLQSSIEQLILKAEKKIHLVCYSMPNRSEKWWLFPIIDRMMKDNDRDIKLIVHANERNQVEKLINRYPNTEGWSYLRNNETDLFHIKAIIIDGKLMYIGSANFSENAINNSTEWGIVAYSADTCIELENFLKFLQKEGRFERV